MNFNDYLIYAKLQLTNLNQFRLIRIVLGNESCDLDSTVSACVYAYFLHTTCSNQNEILYLPVMNTNPSTFRLRTEIRWFFKEYYSNVIFIDDINLNELYDQNKLEIILVDHHYLRSQLNKVVIEIIDHHQIKKDSIILQNSSAIKIEPVGSCCTLIAEKLFESNFEITEEIAYLLTGPILFDTINFSPSAGKTTEKDRQIYAKLQSFRSPSTDSLELYTNLRQSSCDVTGLSVQDLLQKDAKQIVTPNFRLIMSSLPMNYTVEKLIAELKILNDIHEFLSKNDNADGVIMTSVEVKNEETKRQLGFYIKKIEYIQPLSEYIQNKELKLDLHEHVLPINQSHIKLFDQKNVHASRKQILPLIEKFIKDFI
ncbi:unnamed protein product [Rotaria sp. Silwood1]|nr:unnamed protein product [Rotaria sp. Silwood1]CAF3390124.1 unnamed protein product [Rotaria sp. Silwood1]CAF3423957.1 unnamed protein product [Rotaria sp. Silwood1]CAF3436941.1 unnamed protein product [Rotaria sp. Silwood1]CAF4546180.1 unnamed protein product [Rotaria sp. Silwood1]